MNSVQIAGPMIGRTTFKKAHRSGDSRYPPYCSFSIRVEDHNKGHDIVVPCVVFGATDEQRVLRTATRQDRLLVKGKLATFGRSPELIVVVRSVEIVPVEVKEI